MKWRGENAWWKRNELVAYRVAVVLWLVILVSSIVQWLFKIEFETPMSIWLWSLLMFLVAFALTAVVVLIERQKQDE